MSFEDFNIDFSSLEEADFSVGKGGSQDRERITWLGSSRQTWPLDVRFVVNMINKDEARPYHENHFHEYIVNDNYVRVPCPRAIKQTCPVCDAYWDHKKSVDKLTTIGASAEGHPEHGVFKRHQTLMKKFEQKKSFASLVVVKGDNKISILASKPQLTKQIFGDRDKGVTGALNELKAYGVPVFNPAESTGWLTLNKTGTGLGTVYSAKPTLISKIVGKKKEEQLVEESLHPQVVEKFKDMTKLPALNKMIQERMWSQEELENYVESDGTQLPSKVAEYLAKKPGAKEAEPVKASREVVDFSAEEFVPF
jgi:hypothetical protein